MKLMNEEGLLVEKIQKGEADNYTDEQIEAEFNERCNIYLKSYFASASYSDLNPKEVAEIKQNSNAS